MIAAAVYILDSDLNAVSVFAAGIAGRFLASF
jgi:hypothetical protein